MPSAQVGKETNMPEGMTQNDLSAFWMPFTANRRFKQDPRILVSAEGM